jgi:hypothetical protein
VIVHTVAGVVASAMVTVPASVGEFGAPGLTSTEKVDLTLEDGVTVDVVKLGSRLVTVAVTTVLEYPI